MTPKEKAVELVDKYFTACHKSSDLELSWKVCKRITIMTVDEIIKELIYDKQFEFWQQVKTEIKNL